MKNTIKVILQKLFGFDNYLFIFAIYIIRTLRWNKKEGDFIFFRDMIPDEGLILDIGANIGAMAVHLARTHKNAAILAFEPIPWNINALRRIIGKYKTHNISIFTTALGYETGTVKMVMPVNKYARLQGLSHVMHQSITENNEGEIFSTPVTTLDNFLKEHYPSGKVTAIKIDVENFEYFVLEGAAETLRKYKPLVYCELWDNKNRENSFNLIRDLGYKICILKNKKLSEFNPASDKTQNFFFIPDKP